MYSNVECPSSKKNKIRVIVWGKIENPRVSVNLNHIFIYLILTKLLSLFYSLTIYSILNTYYLHSNNPDNSIPPTIETSLDPNPKLYQASRGIKSLNVQNSS